MGERSKPQKGKYLVSHEALSSPDKIYTFFKTDITNSLQRHVSNQLTLCMLVYVTRKADKGMGPSCLIEPRRRKGWIFWGSISGGRGKGPCLFGEKEWGTINKQSYCERIVPLVHCWMRLNSDLVLMHDGAPGHAAKETIKELEEK